MNTRCLKCGKYLKGIEAIGRKSFCQICLHQDNLRIKREAEQMIANSSQATVKQSEPVKQKHAHYYKDVSHLSKIDIYSVCRLFNVTDPEISHAIKKLLCLGQRGLKDRDTDMQNVIDTLQRWQELEKEFAND